MGLAVGVVVITAPEEDRLLGVVQTLQRAVSSEQECAEEARRECENLQTQLEEKDEVARKRLELVNQLQEDLRQAMEQSRSAAHQQQELRASKARWDDERELMEQKLRDWKERHQSDCRDLRNQIKVWSYSISALLGVVGRPMGVGV